MIFLQLRLLFAAFSAEDRSAYEVNATWRKNNNARVTWISAYGRQFQLSVRRVNYGSSRTVVLAKWRKAAIHFMTIRHHKQKLTLPLTVGAHIALIKDFSYQIRLVRMTPDGANLNASVFLDAHQELGIGKLLTPNNYFERMFHGSLPVSWVIT